MKRALRAAGRIALRPVLPMWVAFTLLATLWTVERGGASLPEAIPVGVLGGTALTWATVATVRTFTRPGVRVRRRDR